MSDSVLSYYQKHQVIAGITVKVAVLASELKCGRDFTQLAGRIAVLPVTTDRTKAPAALETKDADDT